MTWRVPTEIFVLLMPTPILVPFGTCLCCMVGNVFGNNDITLFILDYDSRELESWCRTT
jgi:hypothetical protein